MIRGIRDTQAAFRVLRDDQAVFEFEFDYCLLQPALGIETDVVVRIVSPLIGQELVLSGCEIYVTDKVTEQLMEVPPYWSGDRKKLLEVLQELVEIYAVQAVVEEEMPRLNPALEKAREELDYLADQASRVIAEAWGQASVPDIITLSHNFHTMVLNKMIKLNQDGHATT